MERQRHVLVVLPHPDDESGRAGTLAWHIAQGTPVTYICLTLGEMGRNMGNPPFANRMTLPAVRQKELEASCRSIGITDLRMFGLHDKTIEFEDQDALDARLRAVIDEVKPSLITTFYPGFSVHPDHDATGAAVISTVARMPVADRPTVQCVAFSKGCEESLGPPDVVRDVSGYLQQKWGSYKAHRSQFAMFFGNQTLEDKEVQERLRREQFWTYKFN